jgi:hypothetical protein
VRPLFRVMPGSPVSHRIEPFIGSPPRPAPPGRTPLSTLCPQPGHCHMIDLELVGMSAYEMWQMRPIGAVVRVLRGRRREEWDRFIALRSHDRERPSAAQSVVRAREPPG